MGGLVRPLLKVFATLFVVAVAVIGPEHQVSAQTHHVVGGEEGWNSASNLSSWLSGRVFRVGDKLWFSLPATEDSIVELQSLEELVTCDLRNPIRMYADKSNHVVLEKEGTRYFTSGNLENCENGMKLPVSVQNTNVYRPDPLPPIEPYPVFPPPAIPHPSEATPLNVFSFWVFTGLYLSCVGL